MGRPCARRSSKEILMRRAENGMIMIRLLILYLSMRKLRWMNIRKHSVPVKLLIETGAYVGNVWKLSCPAFMICLHTIPSITELVLYEWRWDFSYGQAVHLSVGGVRKPTRMGASHWDGDRVCHWAYICKPSPRTPVSLCFRDLERASCQITMMKELYNLLVLVLPNVSSSTIGIVILFWVLKTI